MKQLSKKELELLNKKAMPKWNNLTDIERFRVIIKWGR